MSQSCVLCGSERSIVLFSGHDWLHDTPAASEVVRCLSCGLVWLWPPPHRPEDAYPDDYAPYLGLAASAGIGRCSGQEGGLRRKARLLGRYGKAPLVDIGCASGDFLVAVRDQIAGPLLGIDVSDAAIRRAGQRTAARLWVGSAQALPLPSGSMGTVTLWHVLEHLARPSQALGEIARVLRPDGILALACPMCDSWEARLFGRFWSGYDVPRHLFSYSRSTLASMLNRAGFESVEVGNVVYGYSSARLSVAFWLRSWPSLRTRQSVVRVAAAILGSCLALAFELMSRLLGNRRSVGVFVARKANGPSAGTACSDQ